MLSHPKAQAESLSRYTMTKYTKKTDSQQGRGPAMGGFNAWASIADLRSKVRLSYGWAGISIVGHSPFQMKMRSVGGGGVASWVVSPAA